MKLLYGQDKSVAAFVADQCGFKRGFGNCTAIGIMDGTKLVAGVVYHNWCPEAGVIEISFASINPRWLTKGKLKALYEYPFAIGCQMVVSRVSENSTRLCKQLTSYGFKPHEIPRLRGRGEAEIIWTLTDEDWKANRFMRVEHGQAIRSAAA